MAEMEGGMMRKLKIWNGRGCAINTGEGRMIYDHFYYCAYSQKDLMELCEDARVPMGTSEIRNYLSAGCWGTPMEGIEKERGIWGQVTHHSEPSRII